VELTEKQLSKLRDQHRMVYYWLHWCMETLDKPDISESEYKIMLKLCDMNLTEQRNVFLLDGELTELPRNTEYYRMIQKPKRQGGYKWEKRSDPYRKPKKDK